MSIVKRMMLRPGRALLALCLILFANASYAAPPGMPFLYTGGHDLDSFRLWVLGHNPVYFTPSDAGWTAALAGENGPYSGIVVGERQKEYSLSAATSKKIADYVAAGGRVVVVNDHQASLNFLNGVFGYSATQRYGCYSDGSTAGNLQSPAAAVTTFAAGPSSVTNQSCTAGLDSAGIPGTARKLYTGYDFGQFEAARIRPSVISAPATTAVFASAFGKGRLVWMGWDFYDSSQTVLLASAKTGGTAKPDVSFDSPADDWYIVLDNALRFVAPNCTQQGITGSKLSLCKVACETVLSAPAQNAFLLIYSTAYRQTPYCSFMAPQKAPVAVPGSGI
jgi:hypothetical protein